MLTGNRNILNSIKGITSVVKLTAAEKTALADRVLPANVLVVDSSNIVYLTDGVTAVKALNPLLAYYAYDKDVVHLTGDETIAGTKTFSTAIVGSVTGNAGSATKLATARTINGTSFNGTANITTANWGTARNISITDGTNTSTAVSVNGSANVSLKLPATIKATFVGNVTGNVTGNCSGSSGSCTGNAATATQFSANATVALTGDATGTSAGSKKGWSVPVTLANSGVTAGTYGPSADVTGNNNATISVPEITVDAKGRVTSVTNRTLTCKNNTYTVNNATLTIQKNGTNVATFTSNASANATANITVPTKVSELTNDSGFLTSHQSLSNYVTLNGAQTISGAKTFTGDIIGINKDKSTEDANSLYSTTAGSKLTYYTTTGGYTTLTNVPAQVNTTLESRTLRRLSDSDWVVEQICHNNNGLYYRKGMNGTWGAWKTFAFTDSNISGNAATATKATGNANGKELTNTIIKGLSISGKTITYTQIDGNTGTLTTQDTVYTHPTTAGNKHIPSGGSSGQFLGWASDGTAKWVNNPNTNTDTLMTQNVSTTNATYPVLLVATADATANQGAKTGIFAKSVKVNPSTNVISASGFSGPLTGNVTGNCSGSSGSCTGNAASATKLQTARTINGTSFDGTANITTANWGTARNISIADATATNTGEAVSVNGSAAVTLKLPAAIKANVTGSLTGNAATATKLATARSLWGNNFDGSAAITGAITGTPAIEFKPVATTANNGGFLDFHYNQSTADYTSRIIESASGTLSINNVTITTGKVVTATTFNGALTGNVTGNCSGSSGSCTGNAASATKLQTARTINGTSFDGTANITTANWGTARNISITDGTNTSTAVSVNGSANVSLKLPATIKATGLTVTGDANFDNITASYITGLFTG